MANRAASPKRAPISDARLKTLIESEIEEFRSRGIHEWDLYLKWLEIQKWLPSQSRKDIDWVKRSIWKPTGISDYRRLEPELLFVRSGVEVQRTNIWGDTRPVEFKANDPLAIHWTILRKLVSTARETGGGGMRMLKFLVRDRVSKKYLGVICISSDFMDLKGREKAIGWANKDFNRPGGKLFGKLNNTAQGQAIVPTQPFGRAFNGTKLLALLCLSDVVAKKWEEEYGDKLVLVTTTALWGNKKALSSYDGLEPYWQRLESTSGSTPIKFTDETYEKIRLWMQHYYPEKYETLQAGRDSKSRAVSFALSKLEIPKERRLSDAVRLAYMSRLYKNTDAFLKGEASFEDMEPRFDNSVESLTDFWRFGIQGDTTQSLTKAQKKKMREEYSPLPQDITLNLQAAAKARIDAAQENAKDRGDQLAIEMADAAEWYEDLATLTWDEARARYLSQVGR